MFINDNGKKTTEKTILIQVNNKQQNWLSHIELRHKPIQDFSFNYARIVDKRGDTIKKLKKNELITRNELSYQSFYQDDLVTEFDLYWDQYPYRIEYSYTIEEDEFLYVAWWTPVLFNNVATIKSSLEVNIPANYEVRVDSSESITYKMSEIEDRILHVWQSSFTKKSRNELYSPPNQKEYPIVKVVPEYFEYGVKGSFNSWQTYGLWQHNLNEGTGDLPISEQIKIEQLIDGIDDKKEIVRRLYHYHQDNIKYVNVAIDVGGLKSYPATYVSQNKYGDCKALTTYMKAMLKHVNIHSVYTKIYAGSNPQRVNKSFPSPQSNHVILYVPFDNDTIWLENTSTYLPFDYLGTFTQGRYGLATDADDSQLVRTPKLLPADVLLERDYKFQISNGDEVNFDLSLTLRGDEFEDFRYFISEKEEKRQYDEVNEHTGIGGLKVNEWNMFDFHRDSTFVQINVDGTSSSVLREIGSFKVINPLKIDLPDFEKPSDRKLDVVINYPINRLDKSGYDLQLLELNEIQIPEGIHIENEFGQYHTVSTKAANKLIVEEKFTLYANIIPIEKYSEFYSFINSINIYKKKSVILIK